MACNLGASTPPPTLLPRASITPPPTIGFSGPSEAPLPGGGTAVPSADIEIYQLTSQVDSDRLMMHVAALQSFYTRHVNSVQDSPTKGVGAARDYIFSQFNLIRDASGGGLFPYKQEFDLTYNGVSTKQNNVIAVLQGTEPGAGVVIVGAHYDSVGDPALTDAETYAPGANDNATGVAALIEMARIMSKRPHRSTVIFAAFAAEEVGRKGSIAFANWLRSKDTDVIAMINIDTIGNHNDRSGRINNSDLRIYSAGPNETSFSRQLARSINFIGQNHALKLRLDVQDAMDRENRYGDHESFTNVGYPSIRLIQALEEKSNADPSDELEDLEAGYFSDSVQSILAILTSLADGLRPPRSILLRDMDGSFGQLRWEPVPGAVGYVIALRRPNSLVYNQQIPTSETFVEWDGFIPQRFAGIAIGAVDEKGMLGPLSGECLLVAVNTLQCSSPTISFP